MIWLSCQPSSPHRCCSWANLARKGLELLADVDLTVTEGSIFALLGPDGAGKTTMVRILSLRMRETPLCRCPVRQSGTICLGHIGIPNDRRSPSIDLRSVS
jgi:ABC-type Na+ transport system ATPase subunit NatA